MEDKEFENKILNTIMEKQQTLINDIFNLINEKYIEKSKVKEMIEKKKKRIDTMHPASDCVLIDDLENQIEVLQELLEDK